MAPSTEGNFKITSLRPQKGDCILSVRREKGATGHVYTLLTPNNELILSQFAPVAVSVLNALAKERFGDCPQAFLSVSAVYKVLREQRSQYCRLYRVTKLDVEEVVLNPSTTTALVWRDVCGASGAEKVKTVYVCSKANDNAWAISKV